jgi:hypothetical protein
MPNFNVACPNCRATLQAPNAPAPGSKMRCPKCHEVFTLARGAPQPPVAQGRPLAKAAPATPPAPARPQRCRPDEDKEEETRARKKKKLAAKGPGNPMMRIVVGVVALGVITVFGVVVVIALVSNTDKKDVQAANNPGSGRPTTIWDPGFVVGNLPRFQAKSAHQEKLSEEVAVGEHFAIRIPKGLTAKSTENLQAFNWVGARESEFADASIFVQVHPLKSDEAYTTAQSTMEKYWANFDKKSKFENVERSGVDVGRVNDNLATRSHYTAVADWLNKKLKGVVFVVVFRDHVLILEGIVPTDAGEEAAAAVESSLLTIHKK